MSAYLVNQMNFLDKLDDLLIDQSKWSQETFGKDSERGPMGALKHLEKESKEAQDAIGTEGLKEELADCFLLLIDAIRRSGFSLETVVNASILKMQVNKARTWPKPTSDEPVEHLK